jgi:hypothetical protein
LRELVAKDPLADVLPSSTRIKLIGQGQKAVEYAKKLGLPERSITVVNTLYGRSYRHPEHVDLEIFMKKQQPLRKSATSGLLASVSDIPAEKFSVKKQRKRVKAEQREKTSASQFKKLSLGELFTGSGINTEYVLRELRKPAKTVCPDCGRASCKPRWHKGSKEWACGYVEEPVEDIELT